MTAFCTHSLLVEGAMERSGWTRRREVFERMKCQTSGGSEGADSKCDEFCVPEFRVTSCACHDLDAELFLTAVF